ncbi:MAG: FAD-dependent oxidoreductase, partial [Oscillospiraceae bacterium]
AKNKSVVIVGGGILGVEAALALRERGCKITIVEHAQRLMAMQADEYASEVLAKRFAELGIKVYTGATVEKTDAQGACLAIGEHLKADLILASVGVRSETALAVKAGLTVNRGIIIDEHMRTSRRRGLRRIWRQGKRAIRRCRRRRAKRRCRNGRRGACVQPRSTGNGIRGRRHQPFQHRSAMRRARIGPCVRR